MRIIHFDVRGWRARFDDGFDDANVSRVADALGLIWGDAHPGSKVIVGYDMRHDGWRLATVAASTLASYGLDVRLSSTPCPTPAVGWQVAHDPACIGGVVLTGSESPCEYGGILVRGADGGTVSSSFLAQLERTISPQATMDEGPISACDLLRPYADALLGLVDTSVISAAGLKVVADPMYGGASSVLIDVLRRAGCRVVPLHTEHREDFDGLHPRPSEPWVDECERVVVDTHAQCGVVLDGDGDRLAMIDERGRLVSVHNLVPLLLEHLVTDRGMKGRVVTTMASSVRIERQAERLGCPITRVPVGFERIYEEFSEGDVLLGCEEFGGVCLPNHLPERDGIAVALLVIEMIAQRGVSLSRLVKEVRRTLGHTSYTQRDIYMEAAQIQSMRNILPGLNPSEVAGRVPQSVGHGDGLYLKFEDGAWVLLRPSRTQPVVRAYCEAGSSRIRDSLLRAAIDIACGSI